MDVGTFYFMLFVVGEHSVESVPGVEMGIHLLPGASYARFHTYQHLCLVFLPDEEVSIHQKTSEIHRISDCVLLCKVNR